MTNNEFLSVNVSVGILFHRQYYLYIVIMGRYCLLLRIKVLSSCYFTRSHCQLNDCFAEKSWRLQKVPVFFFWSVHFKSQISTNYAAVKFEEL